MHAHDLELQPCPVTPLPVAPHQGMATVLGEHPDGGWMIDGGPAPRVAQRAASCLLAPVAGDRVWVVGETGGSLYVLAVLERAQGATATLAFEGDLSIAAAGRMTLGSGQDMQLHTAGSLGVGADQLQVQARSGRAVFQELSVIARSVFASLCTVTRVGKVLELLVDRVTQRSQHSMRAIEGLDHTQAGQVDIQAETTAHVQATHALVNGKELVKMDGGQIHLG